jgi:hypothetical protein
MIRLAIMLVLASTLAAMSTEERDAEWRKAMEESTRIGEARKAREQAELEAQPRPTAESIPEPADVRAAKDREKAERRNRAIEELYGVTIKARLSDMGEMAPSTIPVAMRGFYFLAYSSRSDSADLDAIQTPHDLEFTAETMAIRPRGDANAPIRAMPPPTPVRVFSVRDGIVLRDGRRAWAMRKTNMEGLYVLGYYMSDECLYARFYTLKR